MALLVRMTVFLSILSGLFISVAYTLGQQTPLNPEAYTAYAHTTVHDDRLDIFVLESPRGLGVDLTNRPCFRGLIPGKMIAGKTQTLWVTRDTLGILVMEGFALSGCYLFE